MINQDKLKSVLTEYKKEFYNRWNDGESFKWSAVKCFRDNWDIDSDDFQRMFDLATQRTEGLLANVNNFPRAMMKALIAADNNYTKAMFMELFDESKDLVERIIKFQADAELLREKHNDGTWKNHYQNPNAISTYLWLKYPQKYYIYKYSVVKLVAEVLEYDYKPKKGSLESIRKAFSMYDEIVGFVKNDIELVEMLNKVITEKFDSDNELHTLVIDIAFYIYQEYKMDNKNNVEPQNYWPSKEEYDPKLSKEDWKKYLLEVEMVHHPSPMKMLKGLIDLGGEASCKKLSETYGGHPSAYIGCAMNLGRRAKKFFDLTDCMDGDNSRVFVIPFLGRNIIENGKSNYSYKIRPELMSALGELDLSKYSPYYEEEKNMNCNYWWLNASPKIWSYSEIGIGEVQNYTLYNENGNKRQVFQNFLDAKVGDMIIGYESHPVKQVVAIARVVQENDGDCICFEKIEGLSSPIDYATLKACPELADMEYFSSPRGSLFKLEKQEYDFILDLIRESNPLPKKQDLIEKYNKEKFLNEVYITEDDYNTLFALLKNKKNLILQGAPGVGKTYAAKRLAYAMMGEKDDSRVEFIQFHQNYSYEDFIMGYKPDENGFILKKGIFYEFCQKAANYPDKEFFFIIDEINRGNVSKILGELLMLIERDYRGEKATMAYTGTSFSVPENLYIIGMMNTADRSLAMIDYALRRRFSFFEMKPGFDSDGFKGYMNNFNNDLFNTLIEKIKELNIEINRDDSLGPGFRIGHSYFCGQEDCNDEWMKQIVAYDIIPMLQEYWFDDSKKLQKWEKELSGVFNDY